MLTCWKHPLVSLPPAEERLDSPPNNKALPEASLQPVLCPSGQALILQPHFSTSAWCSSLLHSSAHAVPSVRNALPLLPLLANLYSSFEDPCVNTGSQVTWSGNPPTTADSQQLWGCSHITHIPSHNIHQLWALLPTRLRLALPFLQCLLQGLGMTMLLELFSSEDLLRKCSMNE